MDMIMAARELSKQMQQDERYLNFMAAMKKTDEDETLQQMIAEFNMKRQAYEFAANKGEMGDSFKTLETEVNTLYNNIMENETMANYNFAKAEMSSMLNAVMSIINQCAGGADPDTVEPKEQSGCGGSCGSCGGCA
jgi:cell fate (sporulation/competence/biofilm development) regulator YlbF (YheA/YmcA/DUF963 family)